MTLKDAIIDLYLNVKVRNSDEVNAFSIVNIIDRWLWWTKLERRKRIATGYRSINYYWIYQIFYWDTIKSQTWRIRKRA